MAKVIAGLWPNMKNNFLFINVGVNGEFLPKKVGISFSMAVPPSQLPLKSNLLLSRC